MKQWQKYLLKGVLAISAAVTISGCSAAQEMMASQMEVPTLENQVNRVAVGMTIVRENNIMAYKMPISADAKWPVMMTDDINDTRKKYIDSILMVGPYYSTVHYTKPIQRRMLGSGALMSQLGDMGNLAAIVLDQTVSPLTYRAIAKMDMLYKNHDLKPRSEYHTQDAYVEDLTKYWPNAFSFDGSLSNFLDFKDGELQDIEAVDGDVYETIGDAVIALAPVNIQKDLEVARLEMLDAYQETAAIKGEKGELETSLQIDEAQASNPQDGYMPLSAQEKIDIEMELATVEERIKEAESIADEKEKIYFELLNQSIVALESDLNIDDENYVKLAKNVNIVANEIQVSSTEAYTAFGAALANIAANNIILQFPKELESLIYAKVAIPMHLQEKFNTRLTRLKDNALHLMPNIFIGSYYAFKQSQLAEKYEQFTDVILLAYEAKMEQEAAVQEQNKNENKGG
jgi:hypothetical protein